MRQVVLISGRICTGKSGLAKALAQDFGYRLIRTSSLLKEKASSTGRPIDRVSLQLFGDEKDHASRFRWVFDEVESVASSFPMDVPIVVDNIRHREQLEYFRSHHNWTCLHVHLYAPSEELLRRFGERLKSKPEDASLKYAEADLLKDNEDVDHFKRDADVRINTGRTDHRDTLVRVAARLGLYAAPNVQCVDVIVGGQYGSEGKGHIAGYLAKDYDVLVRVGGPNAGHTVSSASGVYTYHQLPSGTKDTDALVFLGPGMTVRVEDLLKEIDDCKISADRLFIDPQVMIIEPEDIEKERELIGKIGSTGRGGGAAAARRILGRQRGAIRLARDVPQLAKYVGDSEPFRGSTASNLEIAYRKNYSILLEGTQGSGLSLYHGLYPYVTSRDTNVAGCLAEAGISPSRVRRILMVVRSTPIRVGDPDPPKDDLLDKLCHAIRAKDKTAQYETSGPLKHETSFEEVARSAKLDPTEVVKREITSTTKRKRRVGWFEWEQFRHACSLNAPTDIVLTFADYLDSENQLAHRFEQFTEDTIKFIEEVERVAQAPVSLINTRFPVDPDERLDLRTVIDRRNWSTRRRANRAPTFSGKCPQ